ncbi:MAG: glycogen synthase GlgA [Burkholderiaceae bacterium]
MTLHVLFVAAEAYPLAKTGGLADVVGGLASALERRAVKVTILMPGYPGAIEDAEDLNLIDAIEGLPGGPAELLLGRMPDSKASVLLLRNDALYRRPGHLYIDSLGRDFSDNALRFGALAHAASLVARGHTHFGRPDLVHAHDWHAGLVPLLLRASGDSAIPTLLTIHNLAFQGNFPIELAPNLGIGAELLTPDGIEFWGQMSFLKAGVRYSDRLSTVSHAYAKEILTPEFGCGFEGLLEDRRNDLVGIPNGVNTEVWNPARDPLIAARFDALDRSGKAVCKTALQSLFGLDSDPNGPLLAIGSRLTGQKMADIALVALEGLLLEHTGLQVAVLGTGDREYETRFRELAEHFPSRVGVHIGYDEKLAHSLHAGADMLLHGSRYEPFGLTPLYAMRYGTIPIASRVGGLGDSIIDRGEQDDPAANATGILFEGADVAAMTRAVRRALDTFAHPGAWRALQMAGMRADFGWEQSALAYRELYEGMLSGTRSESKVQDAVRAPSAREPIAASTTLNA